MVPVSFVVLTYNEEANLPACLASVKDLVDEIFVVDSGSTDQSQAIARAAGATVVEHPFTTHAEQWLWAIEHLPLAHDWVLALDADQRVSGELADELRQLFADGDAAPPPADGYYVNRRQIFRGRWIRHGGYYPKYLLKLFRRSVVRIDDSERLDHHFAVTLSGRLHHDIIEHNLNEDSVAFWLTKHVRYADLLSEEAVLRRGAVGRLTVDQLADPARRAELMKAMFSGLPKYWRAVGFFLYRYLVRLGFLDGKEGFVFHFLQTCWFRVVVDVMIEEKSARADAQR